MQMQVMIGVDIAGAQTVEQIFGSRIVLLVDALLDLSDDAADQLIRFRGLAQIVSKSGVQFFGSLTLRRKPSSTLR